MDLNKLPLAPAYAIYHPETVQWDAGDLPTAIRLPIASGIRLPKQPNWTFLGKNNFEMTPIGVIAKNGTYLDIVDPKTLPELKLEFEAAGKDPSQRVRVIWTSHAGKVSEELTHVCGERIDGKFDYSEVMKRFAYARLFGEGTCHSFSGPPGPWGSTVANYYGNLPATDAAISYPGKVLDAFIIAAGELDYALDHIDPLSHQYVEDATKQFQGMREDLTFWQNLAKLTPEQAVKAKKEAEAKHKNAIANVKQNLTNAQQID